MTIGDQLVISDKYQMRGFNFLFAEGLRPVRHKDFTVDIDYPRVYRYPATGEPYYFTSEKEDPDFGDTLLTWPCISRKSKIDGVFNIYPLCLKDEEEEAEIFTSHVWKVYTRSKSHEKGKKKVFDFLDYQHENRDWGKIKPYQFIDKVVEILFLSGRLTRGEDDIKSNELYDLVREWVNKSRSRLKELGLQSTMLPDDEFRDKVATPAVTAEALTPAVTAEALTPAVTAETLIKISAGSKLSARLNTVGLYERENVLVHCYREEPPILYGQPGYADYLIYARPTDRVSYPNESFKKAKALIKSIEKIYPYLTEAQIQQAESEVNTIRVNFPDRL